MPKTSVLLRHALLSLVLVLLYLLFTRPEVIVIAHIGLVAWYPATGLTLALMLSINPRYAIVVCLADVLSGTMLYHLPLRSYSLTIGSISVTVFYAMAAHYLRGPFAIDLGLRHRRDVVRYVAVTTIAALGASVVCTACLAADHAILRGEYWESALGWFFGDEVGLLGVAPFLLIHVSPGVRRWLSLEVAGSSPSKQRSHNRFNTSAILEAGAQAASFVLALWVMFGPVWENIHPLYLSYIPIIWIAMRHGIRRVVTGLLALNFGIVLALQFYPPPANLTKVGLLMFVVSAVGLIVGSEVSERHRIAIDLIEQTSYLDSLIRNSPLGIVVLNGEGGIELTNNAFKKLFLYGQSELVGKDIYDLFPAEGDLQEKKEKPPKLPEMTFVGQGMSKSIRRRRRDGSILNLELNTVPVMANGHSHGSYTIYQDVSEQVKVLEIERQHADSLNSLIAELETRTLQMTLLSEMSYLLECCAITEEAGPVVVQSVRKLFPDAVSGTLYVLRPSRNMVETAASWGDTSSSQQFFSAEACWALRRGHLHWNDRSSEGITCSHILDPHAFACLCLPLVGQGETLGMLHLKFAANTTHLTADPEGIRHSRQTLGTTVAGQIALSLANLRLRETLREQSIRDPLTGLFNRRFLQESLDRELKRAARKNRSLSILIIDLDHFKRFNDTFGHDAGDFVLRTLADVFRAFFRADDVICRHGGEEFALLLPESSAEDAGKRSNLLRDKVKQLNLKYEGQLLGLVTLSIGIATFPEHSSSAEELVKIADRCLYRSKSEGRDRVTVAASAHQGSEQALHASP